MCVCCFKFGEILVALGGNVKLHKSRIIDILEVHLVQENGEKRSSMSATDILSLGTEK